MTRVFIGGSRDVTRLDAEVQGRLARIVEKRLLDYYATKDRAMAAEATVGLMLWNGQSRGSLLNVLRLAAAGKPVVVYVTTKKAFVEVREERDLGALLAGLDAGALDRLRLDITAEGLPQYIGDQPALGPPETGALAR